MRYGIAGMRAAAWLLWGLGLWGLGCAGMWAQATDRTVLLDVTVLDKQGKPVAGLDQGAFQVLDNKQPTALLTFQAHGGQSIRPDAVDTSTELLLVVDEVNAPYLRALNARQELEKFLRENGGRLRYPTRLALFTDHGLQLQTEPSVDGTAMAEALHQQEQGIRTPSLNAGFYGEQERLQRSQDALDQIVAQEKDRPGRKVVLWLSPGWPLLSGARDTLSEGQMKRVFAKAVALSTAMRQERMILYSIDSLGADGGTGRTGYYQNFTPALTKPSQAQLGDLGLQVLAEQTGGHPVFGSELIESSLDKCVAELAAFYTLTVAAAPAETPNTFHSLEVHVEPKGLKVRARNGYYAQP